MRDTATIALWLQPWRWNCPLLGSPIGAQSCSLETPMLASTSSLKTLSHQHFSSPFSRLKPQQTRGGQLALWTAPVGWGVPCPQRRAKLPKRAPHPQAWVPAGLLVRSPCLFFSPHPSKDLNKVPGAGGLLVNPLSGHSQLTPSLCHVSSPYCSATPISKMCC